jgi:hypothetical protein
VQDLNVPRSPLETTTIAEHLFQTPSRVRGKAAAQPLGSRLAH